MKQEHIVLIGFGIVGVALLLKRRGIITDAPTDDSDADGDGDDGGSDGSGDDGGDDGGDGDGDGGGGNAGSDSSGDDSGDNEPADLWHPGAFDSIEAYLDYVVNTLGDTNEVRSALRDINLLGMTDAEIDVLFSPKCPKCGKPTETRTFARLMGTHSSTDENGNKRYSLEWESGESHSYAGDEQIHESSGLPESEYCPVCDLMVNRDGTVSPVTTYTYVRWKYANGSVSYGTVDNVYKGSRNPTYYRLGE
ncbi:MAG: hypothetical protein PHQ43_15775 [Dehalococcoidales bacterium]|nr:hypothetical protein [Dehalococcoidales bacterium]